MRRALSRLTATLVISLALAACASRLPETSMNDLNAVLDDFHSAASDADGERYFGHFAPEGVFLGTDGTERWDVDAFRAYALPFFDKGQGWTYHPRDRAVTLSPDGEIAWFDELLDHASYGELRGSGVLRRIAGDWKICQYNLTFTVPNETAKDVVKQIADGPSAD